MADANPTGAQPDLRGFLEAAGRSLAEAQGALAGEILVAPPALAISDAELDVKAALTTRPDGSVALETLGGAEVRRGGIDAALLSSVRVRYVAVPGEVTAAVPARSREEVAEEVRARPDVRAVGEILGGLTVEPTFVPERRRWLVTARDPEGRLVRELILPDEAIAAATSAVPAPPPPTPRNRDDDDDGGGDEPRTRPRRRRDED